MDRHAMVLSDERDDGPVPIASLAVVRKGKVMAKATVDVLVDDLDGSQGAETVRLGWNGDWRELELSKKNLASFSRALDKYWKVGRPVSADGQSSSRTTTTTRSSRTRKAKAKAKTTRDPKLIRTWATDNGIAVPARGRIASDVERQYNEASGRS